MADLSITAASVAHVSGVVFTDYAGATITAGQTVYKDSSDLIQLADANVSSTTAAVKGIALNGGSSGQAISYQIDGIITIGATPTVGQVYVVSANAGGIAPVSDLTANWYTSIVGVGYSSTQLKLGVNATGVLHA